MTIATATATSTVASEFHKGRRALRDTHRRGTLARAPGGSNNRYLNRPAIGVERHGLVVGLWQMGEEFPRQLRHHIEQVRHPLWMIRHRVASSTSHVRTEKRVNACSRTAANRIKIP